jgi:hypothetical protein
VVARDTRAPGATADVPGSVVARATDAHPAGLAAVSSSAPDTDDAQERWLLTEALVDDDPQDDVPGDGRRGVCRCAVVVEANHAVVCDSL